jgi:endonuclease/exonuclease/phosphatase family metal-dependent hydrolase
VEIKVLTYNLWWWNLYGQRGGNHNSAGKLIMNNGPYDIIGFQEIDDAPRILRDAGLAGTHHMVEKKGWPHNKIAIAYKHTTWDKLAEGWAPVGHDAHPQNYGYRGVNWVRLRHKSSGKTVFFVNHHGMLPINVGGDCGGENGALNMLKVIANFYTEGDMVIMVGDFNAEKRPHTSQTVRKLESALHLNYNNWVDNIFSSCSGASHTRNLGTGGSDHPALEAWYRI